MLKIQKSLPILFTFYVFFLCGCIETIDLDIDTEETSIVIDGLISDQLKNHEIRINNSAVIGVGNDNVLTPINGATVVVKGSDGSSTDFIQTSDTTGTYTGLMQGVVGESYHVEINLPDGTLITSAPVRIQPRVGIETIDYSVSVETIINTSGNNEQRENLNLFLSTSFPENDKPFIRWRIEGVYEFLEKYPMALNPRRCYITDNLDINNVKIADGNTLSDNRVVDQPLITTFLNRRFNILYAFNVLQYRISEEEYDYWAQIEQLTNIDGTLFDPPPATIVGNLTNETNPNNPIQGYFSVVSEEIKRSFVDVTERGIFAETNCTSFTFQTNPPECSNCTMIFNSTLVKPDYWPR